MQLRIKDHKRNENSVNSGSIQFNNTVITTKQAKKMIMLRSKYKKTTPMSG